jgi:hypothetical protein
MDDDKLVKTVGVTAMAVVLGLYLLQYVQQVMAAGRQYEYQPYGAIWLSPAGHIMNVSYNEGGEPEYFGEAMPGTANDEAGWRIYRYQYETVAGDLEVVGIRFANGDTNFDKVWDNREEYNYS